MKVEWWYDDATFHCSSKNELVLARLTVGEDGTAQIRINGSKLLEFASEERALRWLADEEYRRLVDLAKDAGAESYEASGSMQGVERLAIT